MLSSSSGYDNTKYFDLVRKQHPVVLTPNAGSIPHYRCIDYLKRIVSRDEWGALPPKDPESLKPLQYPTPFVMFTFTNTEPCSSYEECSASCRQMQKDSIDQGLPDIPFNFMLGDDLNVYEGRGWDIQPHEDWEQFEDKKERILNIAYIGVNELDRFPKLDVMHVRDALIMYGFRHNYIDIRYFRRPRYDEDYEVPLNIYTREMWGAIPPHYEKPLKTPVRMWMFVWSNTKTCRNKKDCMQAMRELQMRDMYRQGMPDIQYNFYITKDLTLYEGRGWHTASTETYKQYSEIEDEIFDICYIGKHKRKKGAFPGTKVMEVMQELIRYGQRHKPRLIRKHYQFLPVLANRNWDPWRQRPIAYEIPFP